MVEQRLKDVVILPPTFFMPEANRSSTNDFIITQPDNLFQLLPRAGSLSKLNSYSALIYHYISFHVRDFSPFLFPCLRKTRITLPIIRGVIIDVLTRFLFCL